MCIQLVYLLPVKTVRLPDVDVLVAKKRVIRRKIIEKKPRKRAVEGNHSSIAIPVWARSELRLNSLLIAGENSQGTRNVELLKF